MTYDADELARLRTEGNLFVAGFEKLHEICGYVEYRVNASHIFALIAERRSLIAALEKARALELLLRQNNKDVSAAFENHITIVEAERDSARALLREMLARVAPWMTNDEIAELRARIEKELAR